ncbi:MAG TPA: hypothetical protein VII60_08610, partial [Acidimicrobiales bacterium]
MEQLSSAIDRRGEAFDANQSHQRALVEELKERLDRSSRGPQASRDRHVARGKLLPRERVDTLL